MKKYLVFDLDGTLVDSLPGIACGVNIALREIGRDPLPECEVRGMIGSGAGNLCAQALGYESAEAAPPDLLESMYSAFRRAYPTCWQGHYTRPYAGISIALAQLVAGGAHVAVLSNKPHEVTEPMVRALFPIVPFAPILGYTGTFPRKPAPDSLRYIAEQWGVDASELTLVGDSLFDARTAQNAGCGLALVAWGYADIAGLREWGAPLFGSVDELKLYLQD